MSRVAVQLDLDRGNWSGAATGPKGMIYSLSQVVTPVHILAKSAHIVVGDGVQQLDRSPNFKSVEKQHYILEILQGLKACYSLLLK